MADSTHAPSIGARFNAARPTKMHLFWSCVATAVVTMIVGFTWGGWVTGATARTMATTTGEDAVAKRLAPICVVRSALDPQRDTKLKALKDVSTWERGDYIKKQGWATMPGEKEPDGRVADECAKLLAESSG
jgi:hypothetical protein